MCDVTSSESSFESENVGDSKVQISSLEMNSNIVVNHPDGVENSNVNHSELKANTLKIKHFDELSESKSKIIEENRVNSCPENIGAASRGSVNINHNDSIKTPNALNITGNWKKIAIKRMGGTPNVKKSKPRSRPMGSNSPRPPSLSPKQNVVPFHMSPRLSIPWRSGNWSPFQQSKRQKLLPPSPPSPSVDAKQSNRGSFISRLPPSISVTRVSTTSSNFVKKKEDFVDVGKVGAALQNLSDKNTDTRLVTYKLSEQQVNALKVFGLEEYSSISL